MIEAQATASEILKEHEAILHEVAQLLQEKEVINHDEIQAIVDRDKKESF